MAKLPEIRRISREEVRDAPDWIELLIGPMNNFMQGVWTALSGNLTVGENIVGQVKSLQFRTGADYGNPAEDNHGFTEFSFKHSLRNRKPTAVILGQLYNSDTVEAPFYDPVTLSWKEANGNVTITYMTGLAISSTYTVTFLVL